jgi:hypothetical protein
MSPGCIITAIVGWLLLAVGTLLAFAEPHAGRSILAVAGAILIAAERIASAIRDRGQ